MLKYPNSNLHLFLIPYRYRYVLLKDYIWKKNQRRRKIPNKEMEMENGIEISKASESYHDFICYC